MGRRTWIKLFTENWLRGSLRQETAATRGIWADMLALAGDSAYGDAGIIKLADGVAITDVQVAGILRITDQEWYSAKHRLIDSKRIKVTIDNVIHIANWTDYQSEYQRQKKYRNHGKVTE